MAGSPDKSLECAVQDFSSKFAQSSDHARELEDILRLLQVLQQLHLGLELAGYEIKDEAFQYGNLFRLARECQATAARAANSSTKEQASIPDMLLKGHCFYSIANTLLYSIAPRWLAKFSSFQRASLFDNFFDDVPPSTLLLFLAPAMSTPVTSLDSDNPEADAKAIRNVAEHLLAKSFIAKHRPGSERKGLWQLVFECGAQSPRLEESPRQLAALLTSIPDRAGRHAPKALRTPVFFQSILETCLGALQEASDSCKEPSASVEFVAEVLIKMCRRGQADLVAAHTLPALLAHVRPTGRQHLLGGLWHSLAASAAVDSSALERWTEALLQAMAKARVADLEAEKLMWALFGQLLWSNGVVRLLLTDKLIIRRVLPLVCLRWLLHFVAVDPPPVDTPQPLGVLESLASRLVDAWSSPEFVQGASEAQQAYLSAGVCLCVSAMSARQLEGVPGLLPALLQGVSGRLDSALGPPRAMGMRVAEIFSSTLDPSKPLLFEDASEPWLTDPTAHWTWSSWNQEPLEDHTSEPQAAEPLEDRLASSLSAEPSGRSLEVDSDDDWGPEDSDLEPYAMEEDEAEDEVKEKAPKQLRDLAAALRKQEDALGVEGALCVAEDLIRAYPDELADVAPELARALLHAPASDSAASGQEDTFESLRHRALSALLSCATIPTVTILTSELYSAHLDAGQRLLILDVLADAARELAGLQTATLETQIVTEALPGPWEEVEDPTGWSRHLERLLPRKPGTRELGKSRRFGSGQRGPQKVSVRNKFAPVAAAFMLPLMKDYDKVSHGVDLLGRDHVVLGSLLQCLGVCLECTAPSVETPPLAASLLDLLKARGIAEHKDPYVRRSALYAGASVLQALSPHYVVAALAGADEAIANGLDWLHTWAKVVADKESDEGSVAMAEVCLQLHSDLALRGIQAIEGSSAEGGSEIANKLVDLGSEIAKLPISRQGPLLIQHL